MKSIRLPALTGVLAAGSSAFVYSAYRRDIQAARERIASGGRVIQSERGPIEFATAGEGPAVLVIHGAGGGFDQGLDVGQAYLGTAFRLVAPSRFGYLGTPVPEDASAEAQAEAYVRVLDALSLDRVPVVAVSAGAPSALQLCLRHPERCSGLVLAVPMTWAPERDPIRRLSPLLAKVVDTVSASDFLFWTAMKVAHTRLVETLLGTPAEVYQKAIDEDRRSVDRMLESILPISRRYAGMRNDGIVANALTRYALEELRVPTLVISAKDDLYGTFENSVYTADAVHARLLTFTAGGHLLVGHEEEVRAQVTKFAGECLAQQQRAAS